MSSDTRRSFYAAPLSDVENDCYVSNANFLHNSAIERVVWCGNFVFCSFLAFPFCFSRYFSMCRITQQL